METIDVHTTKTAKLLKMADFNKNRIQILELAKKMWKPHWSKLSKVQKNMVLKAHIEKTNTENCCEKCYFTEDRKWTRVPCTQCECHAK